MQTARLRELARDYGLPDATTHRVEGRISDGLTQDAAYQLIRQLGGRIAEMRAQRAKPAPTARRPAPRPETDTQSTLGLETRDTRPAYFD